MNKTRMHNNYPYHDLHRKGHVIIFSLHMAHNKPRYHLFKKLNIGTMYQSPYGTDKMTADHMLQDCPLYQNQKNLFGWPKN